MFSASIAYFLLPYAPICTKYSHSSESISSVTSIKTGFSSKDVGKLIVIELETSSLFIDLISVFK